MNTPRGKRWQHRHTNKRIRRVLNNTDLNINASGRSLNRSSWGSAIARKDVVAKPLDNQEPEYVECMSCGEFHQFFKKTD